MSVIAQNEYTIQQVAEMYGARYSAAGEVLVQVTLTKVIGQKDVVT